MKKLKIGWGFVALCSVLGALNARGLDQFFIWVGVVFISVLIHEMGHALTARVFGKQSVIELSFFGGVTFFSQEGLYKWQSFLITFNGPLFGALLYMAAKWGLGQVPHDSWVYYALGVTTLVNLFWTVLNVLPILPMDGGQLLRILFEAIFKNRGLSLTALISLILSLLLALFGFLVRQYFLGSLFFMFAFQNFELYKQARFLTKADADESSKKLLGEALYLYESGEEAKAVPLLESLRKKTESGMIFNQSTAVLGTILRNKKAYHDLYELLKPYPKLYETQLASLMHEAAFFENKLDLVHKLSKEAFMQENSKEVAFRAAVAALEFKNEEAALGWLKTACELGLTQEELKAHPSLKRFIPEIFESS